MRASVTYIIIAMRKDEFSNHSSNNDSYTRNHEFGRTQKSEFSSYQDNPNKRKHELNLKPSQNETSGEKKKTSKHDNSREVERYWVKTGTSVTSASTAQAASGVVHATTVVVSTVAAVAVTTAVGVNLTTRRGASVSFDYFGGYGDYAEYSLVLRDASEDDPFSIKLENKNYSKSFTLNPGENHGHFEGLNLGESYSLTVSQLRLGGDVIYNETYLAVPQSEFYGAEIYDFDFEHLTFLVSLSYEEFEGDLSDFSLHVRNASENYLDYPLTKTYEPQTLSFADGDFFPGQQTSFYVSYSRKGKRQRSQEMELWIPEQTTLDPGSFLNLSLSDFDLDALTFQALIQFDDPDEQLYDFSLVVTNPDLGEEMEFPLEKTTSLQQISFPSGFLYSGIEISSYVCYYRDGVKNQSETYRFFIETDNYQFFGAEIYGFNFDTNTFQAELHYEDDGSHFSDFNLIVSISGEPDELSFALETSPYPQTISFPADTFVPGMDLIYHVTYMAGGEFFESDIADFHIDTLPIPSAFHSVNIIETDFDASTMVVALFYDDIENHFDNFTLHIVTPTSAELTFPLSKTTDEQEISFEAGQLNVGEQISYYVTYEEDGQAQESDYYELTLVNASKFIGLDWDYMVAFSSGSASATLNYDDEAGILDDFRLLFVDEEQHSYEIALEKSKDLQSLDLTPLGITYEHYYFTVYVLYEKRGEQQSVQVHEGNLIDLDMPGFYGIDIDSNFDYENKLLYVQLSYEDYSTRFDSFELTLTDVSGVSHTYDLEETSERQSVDISAFSSLNPDGTNFEFVLTYYDHEEKTTKERSGGFTVRDLVYQPPGSARIVSPLVIQDGNLPLKLEVEEGITSATFVLFKGDDTVLFYELSGPLDRWQMMDVSSANIVPGDIYHLQLEGHGSMETTLIDRDIIFSSSDEPVFYGVDQFEATLSVSKPTLTFTAVAFSAMLVNNPKILFQFDDTTYQADISFNVGEYETTFTVDFASAFGDDLEIFLNRLKNESVDILTSYDTNDGQTITYTSFTDITFVVTD